MSQINNNKISLIFYEVTNLLKSSGTHKSRLTFKDIWDSRLTGNITACLSFRVHPTLENKCSQILDVAAANLESKYCAELFERI